MTVLAEQHSIERRQAFSFEAWLMLFALAILLVGAVLWADKEPQVEKTDFTVTYLAAQILRQGHAAQLYDLEEQERVKATLYTHAEPLIFEHPPFEALLMEPIGRLPYRKAYFVWGLINCVAWLALPFLLRPYAPVPREAIGYLAAWIFAPLGVALYQGQPSILLLLAYVLAFSALRRGSDVMAGVWLALGLFKFQFVLPFALIMLLRRKWKFLGGFSITAAGLGVLSLVAVGWQGIVGYVRLLLTIAGNPSNASYGNAIGMATVQGFVYSVLGHFVSARSVSLIVAAISLWLVWFSARCWSREEEGHPGKSFDLMFAAAVVISLTLGMHMFTHDLSPLMLSMFLVVAHLPAAGRPLLRMAFVAALSLFWISPLYFALLKWHCVYLLFAPLLIFALSAIRLARTPSAAVPTEAEHDRCEMVGTSLEGR